MWLFFAVIYDGLVLLSMMVFAEYPLDNFALIASFLNPIDLSRIMILLKLDISALLGYTGALFQRFFGTSLGLIASWCMLDLDHRSTVLLIKLRGRISKKWFGGFKIGPTNHPVD